MSLRVGLGASQADLDVQGEIDFDFFEESSNSSQATKQSSNATENDQPCAAFKPDYLAANSETNLAQLDPNSSNHSESASSYNFNKPMITISCDDATGAIQKTIETVIPTPYSYKDNKCGKKSPTSQSRKVPLSPRLKSRVFKEDNESSDDSSISSMSESESDVSSVSADSFELNEDDSDSMTDVSPLASPFKSSSPIPVDLSNLHRMQQEDNCRSAKKDGVKFIDDIEGKKQCSKCETIDIHELVKAMKRLKMKQTIGPGYGRRSKSPILTHNAKCKKNMSFSNEEVRRIDNDNQTLLKKIIAQQTRVKPLANSSVHVASPASVNRQRQQRQIEFENLALLKRLESTKPSQNLSRMHLLHDYENRSSGVLSRASSRSSYPCSSSQSMKSSGRSSAVSVKSSNLSTSRSHSLSVMNKSLN